MRQIESLSHSGWEYKYHIVFIPKCRRKVPFGQIRKGVGEVFHRLAKQKESLIEEGYVMADRVHMMILMSPTMRYLRYSASSKEKMRFT